MNIVMGNGASGNCVELIRAIWREKRANKAVKKWAGTVKDLKRLSFCETGIPSAPSYKQSQRAVYKIVMMKDLNATKGKNNVGLAIYLNDKQLD